jgi:hypothetical protein
MLTAISAANPRVTRDRRGKVPGRKQGNTQRYHLCRVLLTVTTLLALTPNYGVAATVPVILGRSVIHLTGPWKFHTGDDATWADPNFDDSAWESLDLTAPPGAHDDDVGLTGPVPGWGAR